MPIDMQRAPKIPPARPASGIDRVEIEAVDDGTYIVTCFSKPTGGAKGGGVAAIVGEMPKRYTFQNADAASGFVADKLHGRSTTAKGEAIGEMAKETDARAGAAGAAVAESKRRPTRGAGEPGAPAYAETQTPTEEPDFGEEEA